MHGQNFTVYNASAANFPPYYAISAARDAGGSTWLAFFGGGLAQYDGAQWRFYRKDNSGLPSDKLSALAIDKNNHIWMGAGWMTSGEGGLVRFDGLHWTVYNTGNSGLPHNDVSGIAIDSEDNMWIATYGGGLALFDGQSWRVYNMLNSGLPSNYINVIAINGSEVWVGTHGHGLAKYDGNSWTVYNTANSALPSNVVYAIAFERDIKWIGTWKGLARLEEGSWRIFNAANSGLPSDAIHNIVVAGDGDKWIGTFYGGLVKFDELNWKVYNAFNSGLPHNMFRSLLLLEEEGSLWLGTVEGVAHFTPEPEVVSAIPQAGLEEERNGRPESFRLHQNFPNPFNPSTTIRYELRKGERVKIEIYNLLGQVMRVLVDERQPAGEQAVVWDGRNQWGQEVSSGVYIYRVQVGSRVESRRMALVR